MASLMERVSRTSRDADIVNILAGVALTILVARTFLVLIPAPYPIFATAGDLVWQLALAYSGAWIFNRLVIEMPRQRDRSHVYRTSARDVNSIVQAGLGVPRDIYKAIGAEMPAELDERSIEKAMHQISFGDPHPSMVAPVGEGGQITRPATWLEAIRQSVKDIDEAIARLQPVYQYYDAEAIERIERITTNYIFMLEHNGHIHRWARDSDFHSFRSAVEELWWNSLRLKAYYDEHLAEYVPAVPNMSSRFPGRKFS